MQWQIKKVQTPTPRILAIIGLLITTKLSDFLHAIVSEGGGGEVNNSWTLSLMERISHLTLWLTCRDDHYLEASLKTHSENYQVNEKNNYFRILNIHQIISKFTIIIIIFLKGILSWNLVKVKSPPACGYHIHAK